MEGEGRDLPPVGQQKELAEKWMASLGILFNVISVKLFKRKCVKFSFNILVNQTADAYLHIYINVKASHQFIKGYAGRR